VMLLRRVPGDSGRRADRGPGAAGAACGGPRGRGRRNALNTFQARRQDSSED